MLYQSQRLRDIFMMVLIICAGSAGAAQTIVTRYEEDFSIFPNPEQGFYEYTDIIKGHLRQLEPVFAVNADVIALFEAGFVGPWGEWHSTSIARDYDQGRDMLLSILAGLSLENRGFASLYNPRKVQIVMRHQNLGTQLVHDIIVDPRLWKPGEHIVIQEVVELAQEMSTGSYTVHLNLPDPYPSLEGDPRYSLRCANIGIWDAHTGYNTLADGVTVGHK